MVGERANGGRYESFFEGKARCVLPPVRVESVGQKLAYHLRRADKGAPQSFHATDATVPQATAARSLFPRHTQPALTRSHRSSQRTAGAGACGDEGWGWCVEWQCH